MARSKKYAKKRSGPRRTLSEILCRDAFRNTPIPIMLEIFNYLNYKTLVAIRRVCRKWKKLIHENQSLFERVFKLDYPKYVNDKPEDQNWQKFYMQTVFSILSDSINNVDNNPEFFVGTSLIDLLANTLRT